MTLHSHAYTHLSGYVHIPTHNKVCPDLEGQCIFPPTIHMQNAKRCKVRNLTINIGNQTSKIKKINWKLDPKYETINVNFSKLQIYL